MAVHIAFRIFYSSFYTLLNIILLVLVLITPGDSIRQALSNHQLYNVFVVAGCYVLTLFLAIIILLSRYLTNRSVLSAIPKTWIPVEKGDVKTSVRKMIVESLSRSAVIAWDARPRIESLTSHNLHATTTAATTSAPATATNTVATTSEPSKKKRRFLHKSTTAETSHSSQAPQQPPIWGEIAHAGWTSPFVSDLPNLQYATVISELPHLIEAKAVSLAPRDPDSDPDAIPPRPDIRVVEILQRGLTIGLRVYLAHLAALNILTDPAVAQTFLSRYERARFNPQPLDESEFRELMACFAELLRSMSQLSPDVFALVNDGASMHSSSGSGISEKTVSTKGSVRKQVRDETDIDDDASSKSTPQTLSSRSLASRDSRASLRSWVGSEGTVKTARSRPALNSEGSFKSFRRPEFGTRAASWGSGKSMNMALALGTNPSGRNMLRPVGARTASGGSLQRQLTYQRSLHSLRRVSTASGSVIRLRLDGEEGEDEFVISP